MARRSLDAISPAASRFIQANPTLTLAPPTVLRTADGHLFDYPAVSHTATGSRACANPPPTRHTVGVFTFCLLTVHSSETGDEDIIQVSCPRRRRCRIKSNKNDDSVVGSCQNKAITEQTHHGVWNNLIALQASHCSPLLPGRKGCHTHTHTLIVLHFCL